MNVIKKELKTNFKLFIIMLAVLIGTFLMAYIVYPFFMNEETMKSLEETMSMLPKELMAAFNMDSSSISTPFGWVKSEGFVLALIAISVYASILGGNILLKEENAKTIEYLGVLPIRRSRIVTYKIIACLIYIFGLVFIFTIFNLVALLLYKGDFDAGQFFLLSFSPLLIALPFFFLNLFISTLLKGNKKSIGFSLAIAFVSYFINMISLMSDKVEFFKYFSINTLADTQNITTNSEISFVCIIISILLSVSLATLSYFRYNKKELL